MQAHAGIQDPCLTRMQSAASRRSLVQGTPVSVTGREAGSGLGAGSVLVWAAIASMLQMMVMYEDAQEQASKDGAAALCRCAGARRRCLCKTIGVESQVLSWQSDPSRGRCWMLDAG